MQKYVTDLYKFFIFALFEYETPSLLQPVLYFILKYRTIEPNPYKGSKVSW